MKIIIVGAYKSELHEYALFIKLLERNYKAYKLKYNSFNNIWKKLSSIPLFKNFIQDLFFDLNEKKILKKIKDVIPDILFFYRSNIFSKNFIKNLKNKYPKIKIVFYNNDNAFSNLYKKGYWDNYLYNCKFVDYILAYRKSDIQKYNNCSNAQILYYPPYISDILRDFEFNINSKRKDICFIGHYENDERLDYLVSLLSNNLPIKLYGPKSGWNRAILKYKKGFKFLPVKKIKYKSYVKKISNLLIGICFLSKLNKDTITRRCFELPYSGVCMVSEYNDELASIFEEDKEAVYFRNKSEFIRKVNYLYKNPSIATNIGLAGRQKCMKLDIYCDHRVDLIEKL
tara:strand:+ start:31376 stop:32401 length:1026 start_codon:yes stop_codon:yes gene_type:complete